MIDTDAPGLRNAKKKQKKNKRLDEKRLLFPSKLIVVFLTSDL